MLDYVFDAELSISIHAPCTGSDGGGRIPSLYAQSFQSTLPARGATALNGAPVDFAAISIHAPCTGSDRGGQPHGANAPISIHAPCTGSDSSRSASTGLT